MSSFKWGILGTGNIAHKFAQGLESVPDAELHAVGSRTQESADRFGDEFDVPVCHGSYAALADDPEVEAIYVSTPHPMHKDNTILCLEAGKPVICEKPFAVNAAEARAMVECARANGVFLLEAMWTRFGPVARRVRELLADGAIGPVQMLQCAFGFRCGWDPEGRLLNPAYAGGGLLDVGVYCVSYARMVFGQAPAEIAGLAQIGATGVDEQASWVFKYDTGQLASLSAGVQTAMPHEAVIMGTDGMIRVPSFWRATSLLLNDAEEAIDVVGNGYNYEAQAVQNCVRAGALESDVLPLDESLEIMATLDRIRGQWGLRYPME